MKTNGCTKGPSYGRSSALKLLMDVGCQELWQDCILGVQACNRGRIQTHFAELVLGLGHHIQVEEQIFFPVFEERTSMRNTGPTAVMRHEHRDIESMLEKLSVLTKAQDCSTIVKTIQGQQVDPSALLSSHDAKE